MFNEKTKRIRFTITEEDIVESSVRRRFSPKFYVAAECPAALALQRMFPEREEIYVRSFITIDGEKFHKSNRLQDFIYDFDNGGVVYPATFVIRGVA